MEINYKQIEPDVLSRISGNAWSIENMEAHGAGGRPVEYIGSKVIGNIIYDYYKDNTGEFWYKNRALLSGEITSVEKYIFGREINRYTHRKSIKK